QRLGALARRVDGRGEAMTTATLLDSFAGTLDIGAPAPAATTRLTVALRGYDTRWHDPPTSLAAAGRLITPVAGVCADGVVLPELATTGATIEGERAVLLDSPDVAAIRAIAKTHRMWVITGIALREARGGCAVNAAIAVDPSGEIAAIHRKRRLFAYAGED